MNVSVHIHILPKQLTRWYTEKILDRIQALPDTEHISIKYEQDSLAVGGLDPSPSSSDLIWQLWGKQSDFPAT